jgi:hypothetical protein
LTFLSWEELDELFHSFERTALRLEVRERYDADVEREPQRRFLAGEPDDLVWAQGWFAMVRQAVREGKVFRRVRVVSFPLSDYNVYALWFAGHTVGAGEDIRYLDRVAAGDLPTLDYWVFDSEKVAIIRFDEEDRPVSAELTTDPATVKELAAALEVALGRAVPRDQFAEAHGLG